MRYEPRPSGEGKTSSSTEGSEHTKVSIGAAKSVVPRHSEINEITAKAILKQMGVRKVKVTAKATRSEGWWAIEVPEVPGVFTQAKRLDQVAAMVRDAVALMEDLDPESVEVDVVPELRDTMRRDVAEALRLNQAAAEAAAQASAQMRRAIADVLGEGLTVRDAATLLDVSPQRVSQLSPKRQAKASVGTV